MPVELTALDERDAKIIRDLSAKFLLAIKASGRGFTPTVVTAALVSAAAVTAAANAAIETPLRARRDP